MIKSWIALICGLILIGGALAGYLYHRAVSGSWLAAKAAVVGNKTRMTRTGPAGKIAGQKKYAPRVRFQTADGQQVETTGDREKLTPWKQGGSVTLYYDPAAPARVTMHAPLARLAGSLAAAFFGLGALWLAFAGFGNRP